MPRYKYKPNTVEATRPSQLMTIETLGLTMVGEVGDWLIVTNEAFQSATDSASGRGTSRRSPTLTAWTAT